MTRVVHVTTGGRIGGAERLLVDVLEAGRQGTLFDARVCVLGDGDELARQLATRGIECEAFGARSAAAFAGATIRLASYLRSRPCDVVHAHLIHGSLAAGLAARIANVRPVVLTRHYERFVQMYGSSAERLMHRAGHSLADHIIAISQAAADVLVQEERTDPHRVTIVPNGVSVDRIEAEAAATDTDALASLPDGPLVGTVGSLHPRKGHDDLIRSLTLLPASVTLVIVGEGPARRALEDLVVDLGLRGRVLFLGHQPQPYPLIQRFTVYAQPSREEGFGIAVLEAMALGRPVVAAAVGGLRELVIDGKTGSLVRGGDVARLSAAIQTLLEDEIYAAGIGERARAAVREQFSAAITASGYARVYELELQRRGSATVTA